MGYKKLPATGADSALDIVNKSAAYTASESDDVILVDTTSAFTLTLYPASGNSGKILTIKKTTNDVNALTIDANASETIDGALTTTINSQYECLKIISDGANWQILERKINESWISFTPTGAFTTNTTYTGFYRRVGDSLEMIVKMAFAGAPNSVSSTINLPTGLTIDTAKIVDAANDYSYGTWNVLDAGIANYTGVLAYSNTTSLNLRAIGTAGTYTNDVGAVTQAVPITFGLSDAITLRTVLIPIAGWKGN